MQFPWYMAAILDLCKLDKVTGRKIINSNKLNK